MASPPDTPPTSTSLPATASLPASVARLVRQALRCFRAQAPAILAVASLVVLGPTVLVELAEEWAAHHDATAGNVALAGGAAVLAAVLGTVGSTFLAGLLDTLVGHHLHGHPFHGLGATFRSLPYGRLIAADLLVALLVVAGTLLCVVPGLVAYTLCAIVGPVIIIEDASVGVALRRSASLVWSSFWLVFVSVTTVTVLEIVIEESLEHLGITEHVVGELAVSFLVGVLIGSVAALIKVCVAYELIGRGSRTPAVTDPSKG